METVAKNLSAYLHDLARGDAKAWAHVDALPKAFHDFARELGTMVVQMQKTIAQMQAQSNSLERHANQDSMTALFNRRYGMTTLNNWLQEKKQFVVVFADLDNLKYINDVFGHGEGDIYIINAAKHLQTFSADAVVCRVGGDEFLLLAPHIGYDEAERKLNIIYENLRHDDYLRDKPYEYSLSYGIAAVEKENTLAAGDILSLADERMYESKRMRKRARKEKGL